MHLGFFLHLAFAHFPLPSDSDKKSNEAESSLGSFGCDLQVLSSLSLTWSTVSLSLDYLKTLKL